MESPKLEILLEFLCAKLETVSTRQSVWIGIKFLWGGSRLTDALIIQRRLLGLPKIQGCPG